MAVQLLSKWRGPLARDGTDIVRALFQVKLKVTLKCDESDETTQDELDVFAVKCNITGDINHLHEGIRLGLVEDREKSSEVLQRTAMWRGDARLAELPAYLSTQVVRFFYKVQAQQKAKIMRKVCPEAPVASADAPPAVMPFDLCVVAGVPACGGCGSRGALCA